MSDRELARVANFRVAKLAGGELVGQVAFRQPVCLLDVDLDQAVQLERGVCNVVMAAPAAYGLNVPAVVTLHGVLPGPGADAAAFAERVRAQTAAAGGRLIKYDAAAGEWVFEVDRFA